MDVHETIKDIKGQFRLFMNGVASQSMREKGLDYKLNFGIELPRLKEIAARYEKNHEVAQALWKENIRECKILAGMLQPVETFYPKIADMGRRYALSGNSGTDLHEFVPIFALCFGEGFRMDGR